MKILTGGNFHSDVFRRITVKKKPATRVKRLIRWESGANGYSPDGRNEALMSDLSRAGNAPASSSTSASPELQRNSQGRTENLSHAPSGGQTSASAAEASHEPSFDVAAAQSTAARNAHDTGVSDSGRWSTRRIAIYALFVALAMATSFVEFPIMPGVPWLKYDPSGIVCLIAGFTFGPSAAGIVSVLGFTPHLLMDPWGTLMAVLVSLALSVPAALVYKYRRSQGGAIAGILLGAACALVAAILGNLVVTPIYAHMSVAQVAALIVPALLPFNLIKFAIHGVATYLIYKPVSNLLHR
ncbi:membrane protein [Bifidobacterium subtile]|uniref:Membrane protein n=2 Tax=Bifidobacterium subtile TaxID=77635 RepID=A0A087EB73_9BIFI|nr:membrane protein [Bifidobacterium subtile]